MQYKVTINNYQKGAKLKTTPTHKIISQKTLANNKHEIIYDLDTDREKEFIQKVLGKKLIPIEEKLEINENESSMKYKTYGSIEKCFNILVNEKGYSKEEAQDIIDHILADYKYNPNSTDSLLRRINLVLPKDEYEKEFGIAERYTRLKEKEASNIEVKHEGILEVPEGKNVADLPLSHFVDLANKKGLSKITKALNNLQVWNKNDDKKLSRWAGNMIDKLNKKLKKDESLKKLNETNAIVIDIPKQEYDFHFKGTDKDGWKRDVHKVIVNYNNKGYFVDLILIDNNGVKVNSVRKKFKFVGKDVVITDADRNDIVIGHIVDNRNESLKLKNESISVKDARAIVNSDMGMHYLGEIEKNERNLFSLTPNEYKNAMKDTRKYVNRINSEIADTLPKLTVMDDEYKNSGKNEGIRHNAYNLDNDESRRKEIADRFGGEFNPDNHILICKDNKSINIQVGKKYRCTAFGGQRVEIVSIDNIFTDNRGDSASITALYRNRLYEISSTQLYESTNSKNLKLTIKETNNSFGKKSYWKFNQFEKDDYDDYKYYDKYSIRKFNLIPCENEDDCFVDENDNYSAWPVYDMADGDSTKPVYCTKKEAYNYLLDLLNQSTYEQEYDL